MNLLYARDRAKRIDYLHVILFENRDGHPAMSEIYFSAGNLTRFFKWSATPESFSLLPGITFAQRDAKRPYPNEEMIAFILRRKHEFCHS